MDQGDIEVLPLRDGEQSNPTVGSLMEKGMQVGPPQHRPWVLGDGCCPQAQICSLQ